MKTNWRKIFIVALMCFGIFLVVYFVLSIFRAIKNTETTIGQAILTGLKTAILSPVTFVGNAFKMITGQPIPGAATATGIVTGDFSANGDGQSFQDAQTNYQNLSDQFAAQNGGAAPPGGALEDPRSAYWSSLANSLSFGLFGSNGDN